MTPRPPAIVYAALDEYGSLTADSAFFSMAVVVTPAPLSLRHLIRRAASRSGKRLGRPLRNAAEIKWSNASQRIRDLVLAKLAEADVEIFALTVLKGERRAVDNKKTEPPDEHAPQKREAPQERGEQINRLPAVPGLTFRFQE